MALRELEGLKIESVVPYKEVIRVARVIKKGEHIGEKPCYRIDFRGIRSKNVAQQRIKDFRYRGTNKMNFNSPKKLRDAINGYFESCYEYKIDRSGKQVYDHEGNPVKYQARPFTVSGLALAIGIPTSDLHRYSKGYFDEDMKGDPNLDTFQRIIAHSRQLVEQSVESRIYHRDSSFGAKFVLDSAFGWCTQRDRAEIEEKEFNKWLKKAEFEWKKELAKAGVDASGLEIKIVRKED